MREKLLDFTVWYVGVNFCVHAEQTKGKLTKVIFLRKYHYDIFEQPIKVGRITLFATYDWVESAINDLPVSRWEGFSDVVSCVGQVFLSVFFHKTV